MKQWNEHTGELNDPRSLSDITSEANQIAEAGDPKGLLDAGDRIRRLAELVADLAMHVDSDEVA